MPEKKKVREPSLWLKLRRAAYLEVATDVVETQRKFTENYLDPDVRASMEASLDSYLASVRRSYGLPMIGPLPLA